MKKTNKLDKLTKEVKEEMRKNGIECAIGYKNNKSKDFEHIFLLNFEVSPFKIDKDRIGFVCIPR